MSLGIRVKLNLLKMIEITLTIYIDSYSILDFFINDKLTSKAWQRLFY